MSGSFDTAKECDAARLAIGSPSDSRHQRSAEEDAAKAVRETAVIEFAKQYAQCVDMVRDTRADMGERFHADVLTARSMPQLLKQDPGRLLIVGRKFANQVGLILDEVPGSHRNVILVHGADI